MEVTATGDHILDVSCRGSTFDAVGRVGDLAPGDRFVVTVRTAGTPAPLEAAVHVRAADVPT